MFEDNNFNGTENNGYGVPQQNTSAESQPTNPAQYYYSGVPSYQYAQYSAPVAPQAPTVVPTVSEANPQPQKNGIGAGKMVLIFAITAAIALFVGAISGYIAATETAVQAPSGNTGNTGTQSGSVIIYESVDGDSSSQILDSNATIAEVAKKVGPSVVEITTEVVQSGGFLSQYIAEGAGSGVIISEDGYIITNDHVIDGAKTIKVILNNGQSATAKLVGTDPTTDIAVIKIEATGLIPATFGSSDSLEVGDFVLAVGNPLGELGGTVTNGIISALEREITVGGVKMTLLQTNAAINPGNSGGGLFNSSGELIGIVNAKAAGEDIEGLGFAIPIDVARPVAEDLITDGRVNGRVTAGIEMLDILDYATAFQYRVTEFGPYIYIVDSGSDAERAGLKSGDLIEKVDGKLVYESADVLAIINQCKVGDTITFTVSRNGRELQIPLTFTD